MLGSNSTMSTGRSSRKAFSPIWTMRHNSVEESAAEMGQIEVAPHFQFGTREIELCDLLLLVDGAKPN